MTVADIVFGLAVLAGAIVGLALALYAIGCGVLWLVTLR